MKKLSILLILTAFIAAGFTFNSCKKDEVQDVKTSQNMELKVDPDCGYPIVMAKDYENPIACASIYIDEDLILHVDVTFDDIQPWAVTETHLYYGENPPDKWAPGQFEFALDDNFQWSTDASWFTECDIEYTRYFALHFQLEMTNEEGEIIEETAWLIPLEGGLPFTKPNGTIVGWGQYFPVVFIFDCPVIDGVMNEGEWDRASVIPVTGEKGNVYVLEMPDYLYVAFNINDFTDDRIPGTQPTGNDAISINVNPTDAASYGLPCDIIFQTGTDANAWGGSSSGMIDNYYTQWVVGGDPQVIGLPVDLESVTLFNTNRVTEWKLPLTTFNFDPQYVGGNCQIDAGPTHSNYRYPVGLQWSDQSTYFPMP